MEDRDPGFDERYDPETLAALASRDAAQPEAAPMMSKVSRWSRRTALGMVLKGVALGLQEVLDPEDDRQIVIEVDDEGTSPHLPIQLFLDPDSPAGSLCLVRRHAIATPSL
jgi:hypothetical protein